MSNTISRKRRPKKEIGEGTFYILLFHNAEILFEKNFFLSLRVKKIR